MQPDTDDFSQENRDGFVSIDFIAVSLSPSRSSSKAVLSFNGEHQASVTRQLPCCWRVSATNHEMLHERMRMSGIINSVQK